jgi:hypothetical protein
MERPEGRQTTMEGSFGYSTLEGKGKEGSGGHGERLPQKIRLKVSCEELDAKSG